MVLDPHTAAADLLLGRVPIEVPVSVAWSEAMTPTDLACRLPPAVGFRTSGSTGTPTEWFWSSHDLVHESAFLRSLIDVPIDVVAASAPPRHLYGAVASVLLPALLGARAQLDSRAGAPPPDLPMESSVLVVAVPLTLSVLTARPGVFAGCNLVRVLYSSATLDPAVVGRMFLRSGCENLELIEVLGSTETGGVASRRWTRSSDLKPLAWRVAPHVSLCSEPTNPAPHRLTVESPTLASRCGIRPLRVQMDDVVRILDPRHFERLGRGGRIVKVNGQRYDLDAWDGLLLEAARDCGADMTCRPVLDPMIGEHFEVLVVLPRGVLQLPALLVQEIGRLPLQPRRVRIVDHIDRTALGKAIIKAKV